MANTDYKKSQKVVINPYTFVPVASSEKSRMKAKNSPDINGDFESDVDHADIKNKKIGIRGINAAERYGAGQRLRSGVLHCSLYLRTPLAVPDVQNVKIDNGNGHKTYSYSLEDGLAISGSSIRGMLRSVYETLTNSCFVTQRKDKILHSRVEPEDVYQAGIIKKNPMGIASLYKAERYWLPISQYAGEHDAKDYAICLDEKGRRCIEVEGKKLKTGDIVCFTSDPKNRNKVLSVSLPKNIKEKELSVSGQNSGRNKKTGTLYIGEYIEGKQYESIFIFSDDKKDAFEFETEKGIKPKTGKEVETKGNITSKENMKKKKTPKEKQEIILKAMGKMEEAIKIYGNPSVNNINKLRQLDAEDGMVEEWKLHSYYAGYDEICKKVDSNSKDVAPVWYKFENGCLYFSPAAIGRKVYNTTMNDLLGEMKPCTDRKNLCEACALFGMIGEKDGKSLGSRIRVTDATGTGIYGEKPQDCIETVTLRELGMPHSSYLPFYFTESGGNVPRTIDKENVKIAGRKYYWHHPERAMMKKEADKKYSFQEKMDGRDGETERNSTIDLVKPNLDGSYEFDLFYDGITEEQLKKLLWTVNLGENYRESDLCHKLGQGKPLGLGSVKIVIQSCEERRIIDGEYRILRMFEQELKQTPGQEMKLWGADAEMEQEHMVVLKKVLDMREPFQNGANKNARIEYPGILDKDDQIVAPSIRRTNNDVAGHRWYSLNKNGIGKEQGKRNRGNTVQSDRKEKNLEGTQMLPKATDTVQTLNLYRYTGEN